MLGWSRATIDLGSVDLGSVDDGPTETWITAEAS